MAIEFISVKCPNCQSNFKIEDGRKTAFCAYCGTQIIINNDRSSEYTYRRIDRDESKIHRADVEKAIRLKELELEAETKKQERKEKTFKRVMSIFLILLVTGSIIVTYIFEREYIYVPIALGMLAFVWFSDTFFSN